MKLEIIEGEPPNKQQKLVSAWMEIHKDELLADWEPALDGQQPYKIGNCQVALPMELSELALDIIKSEYNLEFVGVATIEMIENELKNNLEEM